MRSAARYEWRSSEAYPAVSQHVFVTALVRGQTARPQLQMNAAIEACPDVEM